MKASNLCFGLILWGHDYMRCKAIILLTLKLVGAASVSEDLVLIHSGLSSNILVIGGEYE